MTIYKVRLIDGAHYVIGLPFDGDRDSMLIYRYPAGDIDTRMTTHEMMHHALYGEYQVNDALHEGDEFDTEFGWFVAHGVHVSPKSGGDAGGGGFMGLDSFGTRRRRR